MPETPPITVRFENSVEEHARAAQLYYRTTFWHRGDKVVAILLLLFGIYVTATIGVYWWTVVFIALAPVEWFNLLSAHRLRAKLWFKWNPKYREPYEITFSDDGIHFRTPTIDSNIDWKLYNSMLEDGQIFVLIYGKWMYAVIPKRAFADVAEENAFRELVRLHGL